MQILDGIKLAQEIKEEIKNSVSKAVEQGKRPPHLAAVLVGSDGASQTYVSNKIKDCQQVGFKSSLIKLPNTVSQTELIEEIEKLNLNPGEEAELEGERALISHRAKMAETLMVVGQGLAPALSGLSQAHKALERIQNLIPEKTNPLQREIFHHLDPQ